MPAVLKPEPPPPKPKPRRRTAFAAGDVVTDPTIGHGYRVIELIGKGGQAEVWRGASVKTGEPCAVKTILAALSDDPKNQVRAEFEATTLRELRHPNVVQVFASGVREDGGIFMVMELLKGETLQELLRVRGKLTVRQAIRIVRDICLGLEAVHQYAIHRDIKPANLHLGLDGVIRLLDLGACKWKQSGLHLTSTGMQLGTILYMSPEALDESTALDARGDIWSLGIVLYELLTGMSPFAFEDVLPASRFLIGNRILNERHVPLLTREPSFPPFLEQILSKALAKDPAQRFSSAEDFGRVLTGAIEYFERLEGSRDVMGELVEEMADRAPTLAPPEPRPAPQRATVAAAPEASPRTEGGELALAATDEVPRRAVRSTSGEYERGTMIPSPSATWDLSIDDGAGFTPLESEDVAVSGAGHEAMWLPSWQPAPAATIAQAPTESSAARSAPVAVWQPAPIAPTARPPA
jgi:serine/threonine-protein kinase